VLAKIKEVAETFGMLSDGFLPSGTLFPGGTIARASDLGTLE
jgi:hypothetical protein